MKSKTEKSGKGANSLRKLTPKVSSAVRLNSLSVYSLRAKIGMDFLVRLNTLVGGEFSLSGLCVNLADKGLIRSDSWKRKLGK